MQLTATALPCQRCPVGECFNYVELDTRYECTCGHKNIHHAPAGPPAGPLPHSAAPDAQSLRRSSLKARAWMVRCLSRLPFHRLRARLRSVFVSMSRLVELQPAVRKAFDVPDDKVCKIYYLDDPERPKETNVKLDKAENWFAVGISAAFGSVARWACISTSLPALRLASRTRSRGGSGLTLG